MMRNDWFFCFLFFVVVDYLIMSSLTCIKLKYIMRYTNKNLVFLMSASS